MSASRFGCRAITLMAAAGLLAACTGSAGLSPGASATSRAEGSQAPAPLATPSVLASAPVASVMSPSIPDGWVYLSWQDPAYHIALPPGWDAPDPKDSTYQADELASMAPLERKDAEDWNAQVSAGTIRFTAFGGLPTAGGQVPDAYVTVYVEREDASLSAAADRDEKETREAFPGIVTERSTAQTPAGDAITLAYSGTFDDGSPFSSVDYILRLADGRTMTLVFSGYDKAADPAAVARFGADAVATLAAGAVDPTSATPSAPATLSPAPPQADAGSGLLTLPENWTAVEMTEAGLRNEIAALRDANPEFVSMAEQWLDNGTFEQYSFFALGYEDGAYVGNVNIIRTAAEGLSLDGVEPYLLGQLSQIPGVSETGSRRVKLPIGDALLVTDTVTVKVRGADVVQTQRLYFVIEDDVLYSVSFTCAQGRESCLDDAEAMINTFRP